MKNLKLYYIPIIYMMFYTIALLITGVWLFLLSQGLSSSGLLLTLSNITEIAKIKSLHNFIEVASPHIFTMGTLIFINTHFMLFSKKFSQMFSLKVSLALFVMAFMNIFIYLFIIWGFVVSGWIKLISIALFILLFLLLLSMLVFSL